MQKVSWASAALFLFFSGVMQSFHAVAAGISTKAGRAAFPNQAFQPQSEVIVQQGFGADGGTWNYTPHPEAFEEDEDIWSVQNSLGTLSDMPATGSAFWGVRDLDSSSGVAEWGKLEFAEIDVSGYVNVTISFAYEANAFDKGDKLAYAVYANKVRRDSAVYFDGNALDNASGTFTLQVNDVAHVVQILLYVKQDGTDDYAGFDNVVMEGTQMTTTPDGCAENLFISEYAEGSSYNKYLEITNQTCGPVDLSKYRINVARNEGAWGSELWNLDAVNLADGENWVLADNDASQEVLDEADETFTFAGWNGNDAIALEKHAGSWQIVDQIAKENCTTCWEVAGESNALENHTLRRKQTVVSGTTNWEYAAGKDSASSQWLVYPEDDFSDIGKHEVPHLWLGYISSDWQHAGNWNWNHVPGIANDVEIPAEAYSGLQVTTQPATPAVINNLTIAEGGRLVIQPGRALTVNGLLDNQAGENGLVIQADDSEIPGSLLHSTADIPAAMQLYFAGTQWHYIASPIAAKPTADFNLNNFLYWDASVAWQGTGDNTPWKDYTQGTLVPAQGYAYYYYKTILEFSGALNQGNYTINLHRSLTGDATNQGWNLIGNPYPSALDWDQVVADAEFPDKSTEIESAIYFFDDSPQDGSQQNYRYYVPTDGTGGNGVGTADATALIPPGQAFFVRALQDGIAFPLKNAFRSHAAQPYYKARDALLRLVLSSGSTGDECVIRHHHAATQNFDARFDARKLFPANDSALLVYTLDSLKEEAIAINSVETQTNPPEVPLAVKTPGSGEYTLKVTGNTFPQRVYLADKQEERRIPLTEGRLYNFYAQKGELHDRFALIFNWSATTGATRFMPKEQRVYVSNSRLMLHGFDDTKKGRVRVYTTDGKLVRNYSKAQLAGNKSLPLNLPAGVYFVHMVLPEANRQQKIVVH